MAETIREDLLRKLELIKDLKTKMVNLEKLRLKVKSECDIMDNEDNFLQDYKSEMELLMQEKMAHVEELRLIHADINLMESTIKQSEEERAKALEKARLLYEEQRHLKDQLERLKMSVGVEDDSDHHQHHSDPDHEPTEDESLAVKLFETNKVNFSHYQQHLLHHQQQQQQQQYIHMQQQQQQQFFSSTPSALSSSSSSEHNFNSNNNNSNNLSANNQSLNLPLSLLPLATSSHHHPLHLKGPDLSRPSSDTIPNSSAMAAFRQQPPPMKACLSCHQQIHRNAPICPLCKAKSRSRNPKKPKRKMDEWG